MLIGIVDSVFRTLITTAPNHTRQDTFRRRRRRRYGPSLRHCLREIIMPHPACRELAKAKQSESVLVASDLCPSHWHMFPSPFLVSLLQPTSRPSPDSCRAQSLSRSCSPHAQYEEFLYKDKPLPKETRRQTATCVRCRYAKNPRVNQIPAV
jgi:hypothetical protein